MLECDTVGLLALPDEIERRPFPLRPPLSLPAGSTAHHKFPPIDESRGAIPFRARQPHRALNPRRRSAGVREASVNLVFYPAAFTYGTVRALYKVVHVRKT